MASAPAEAALIESVKQVRAAATRAFEMYHPSPYPGRITLFRASVRPDWYDFVIHKLLNGWPELALGGLDVREIRGTHWTLFDEPQLSVLVRELEACLALNSATPLAS